MSFHPRNESKANRVPSVIELRRLFEITGSSVIARRYLVTNGVDASLAMLGLIVGFRSANDAQPEVALTACFGAAVALSVSSFSSTYISESAERHNELNELCAAMLQDLPASAHRRAVTWVPLITAAISALSPFLATQIIMMPLWIQKWTSGPTAFALNASVGLAFGIIFAFGMLLGRIRGQSLLSAAIRTLAIALVTAGVISLIAP